MNETASGKRRYLAAFLPFLSSERFRLANGGQPEGPFVLVEKHRGAVRIAAVDVEALALGMEPGLALADARAREPTLAVHDHDPAADRAFLGRLVDGCERYTPMAAADPPAALILDITGCGHAFANGDNGLAADLGKRLARAGLTCRLAMAATPDAALALAQYGGEHVESLPVAALRMAEATHTALRRAGLRSIGDLASRPRAPLAARFGAGLPSLLARVLGEEDVRITPRRRPAEIEVEMRFAEPLLQTEAALGVIGELAADAAARMDERGAGGRRFDAAFFRTDGAVSRLTVETGLPTRDPPTLVRLFSERIAALADPIDPGFGYDLIRLAVPVTQPLAPEQLRLEGGSIAESELADLLDRLSTRLGKGRVLKFRAKDSHRPEQAAFELPAVDTPARCTWHTPPPGEPPLRPIHLFDPPQRIEVVAEIPDGPPRQFRWRRVQHIVVRYEGPERIAAEWWRYAGNRGLTRDYYRIEDARGRRFWVFRHGLYGSEKKIPHWYLHGRFA